MGRILRKERQTEIVLDVGEEWPFFFFSREVVS